MPKTGKNSKGSVFKKKTGPVQGNTADFSKKRAKVGKKVERATVTKISVQSKQIHVPLQSQITAAGPHDENGVLDKILKQLRHYSSSNRTQALTDLNEFLLGSPHAESYSSLIIPQAMELLFDDEADTREALLVLMGTITVNIQPASMKAVMSVLVTYICSGLTSLNKGVRKDALLLLCQVSDTQVAELLPPFLDKILKNILGLLNRASLIFNAASTAAGAKSATTAATTAPVSQAQAVAAAVGAIAKPPGQKQRGGAGGLCTDKEDKAVALKAKENAAAHSNLLMLLLHVIRVVLASAANKSNNKNDANIGNTRRFSAEAVSVFAAAIAAATVADEGGASSSSNNNSNASKRKSNYQLLQLPFVPRKRSPLIYNTGSAATAGGSSGSSSTDGTSASTGGASSSALAAGSLASGWIAFENETALCEHLRTAWARLSLGQSMLKATDVRPLVEAARSMLLLGSGSGGLCEAYVSLVKISLAYFPYSAAEAQVYAADSALVLESSRAVHSLNLILCEVALGCCRGITITTGNSSATAATGETMAVTFAGQACTYLLGSTDDLIARFRLKSSLSSSVESWSKEAADMHTAADEDNEDNDGNEEEEEEEEEDDDEDEEEEAGAVTATARPGGGGGRPPRSSRGSGDAAGASAALATATSGGFSKRGAVYSVESLNRRNNSGSVALSGGGEDLTGGSRLFGCLQQLVLDPKLQAWLPGREEIGDAVLYKLLELTQVLRDYPSSGDTSEGGQQRPRQHGQKDIRGVVAASMECQARMCIDSEEALHKAASPLEGDQGAAVLSRILAISQPLLHMPALFALKGWAPADRARVTDLFLQALLTVLRRLPSSSYCVTVDDASRSGQQQKQTKRLLFEGTAYASQADYDEAAKGTQTAWPPVLQRQVHAVIACVTKLFTSPATEANNDSNEDEDEEESFYLQCSSSQRLMLLHIFALTPFKETAAVAATLGSQLADSADVTADEVRLFLRGLLQKRHDMTPGAFVGTLFSMLSAHNEAVRGLAADSDEDEDSTAAAGSGTLLTGLRLCSASGGSGDGAWLGSEVSSALLLLSSPVAPGKIVSFLAQRLSRLTHKQFEGNEEGEEGQRWLYRHHNHCALAAMCTSLLPPCFRLLISPEQGIGEGGAALASTLICIAQAAVARGSESLSLLFSEAAVAEAASASANTYLIQASSGGSGTSIAHCMQEELLSPIAALMMTSSPSGTAVVASLRSDLEASGLAFTDYNTPTQEEKENGTTTAASIVAEFPVFEVFCRHVHTQWHNSGSQQLEQAGLARALSLFLRHRMCADVAFRCRAYLRGLVASLSCTLIAPPADGRDAAVTDYHNASKAILRDLGKQME